MKNRNPWKVVAIIFIILFVLSAALLTLWWSAGAKYIKDENTCAYNICSGSEGYDSYQLDYTNNVCYCYKNGEIAYQEFMS